MKLSDREWHPLCYRLQDLANDLMGMYGDFNERRRIAGELMDIAKQVKAMENTAHQSLIDEMNDFATRFWRAAPPGVGPRVTPDDEEE